MKVILASSSPRRKQLLNMLGLDPIIIHPNIDEQRIGEETITEHVKRVTMAKARSIFSQNLFHSLVISSDTVVILDGEVIGKPVDRKDAETMLKKLSGRGHIVLTGLNLLYQGKQVYDMEETRVYFDTLTDEEIRYYLDKEDYLDKAGAYAIQGMASLFVSRIEGCFFNVMGFPVHLFQRMLKKMDIQLKKILNS